MNNIDKFLAGIKGREDHVLYQVSGKTINRLIRMVEAARTGLIAVAGPQRGEYVNQRAREALAELDRIASEVDSIQRVCGYCSTPLVENQHSSFCSDSCFWATEESEKCTP